VPETLRSLKQSGYRLAVVSNRSRAYDELLESLGLDTFFEFALAAGEHDAWKPEPHIFNLALERLGVSASETLYVGDNYYADVIGAQRASLRPVLIDPENIFPEADCTSIRSIGELPGLLAG
jgi:putative hydrolase of the HAD superfamily